MFSKLVNLSSVISEKFPEFSISFRSFGATDRWIRRLFVCAFHHFTCATHSIRNDPKKGNTLVRVPFHHIFGSSFTRKLVSCHERKFVVVARVRERWKLDQRKWKQTDGNAATRSGVRYSSAQLKIKVNCSRPLLERIESLNLQRLRRLSHILFLLFSKTISFKNEIPHINGKATFERPLQTMGDRCIYVCVCGCGKLWFSRFFAARRLWRCMWLVQIGFALEPIWKI